MEDDYYELMGWDVYSDVPTRETLEKFGLHDVVETLARHGEIAP